MMTMRTRFTRDWMALPLCLGAVVLSACGGGGDGFVQPPPPPPAVSISIAPLTASVNVGANTSLAVSISGGSPTPTLASCSSSNTGIATVAAGAASCVVTGVAPGSVTITAAASTGQTATATVTVAALGPALTGFTLTPPTATLIVGQTLPLVATPVHPAGVTVTVTYLSSATAVATVSAAGVVSAVSPGTATITVTAQGTGSGFTPTSLVLGTSITVNPDPCAPIAVAVPSTRNSTLTANSCVVSGGVQRRGEVLRTNLAAPTALEMRLTPTGFAPYISAFPVGEGDFIFSTRPLGEEARRIWHLPAGPTEMRIGAAAAGQVGSFTLQLASVSLSVENCVSVILGGSVSSQQSLTPTDCRIGDTLADEFLVYSTRPCVITMNRVTTGGGMADPLLEAYAGSTLLAFDDDGGGLTNARLALLACRSLADDIILIRATSFDDFDAGTYTFAITIGAPFIGMADGETFSSMSSITKPRRNRAASSVTSNLAPAWLGAVGVSTLPPAQ